MNIPKPQFHTQMLGDERVFWACEPMLFYDDKDKAVLIPANFVSNGFSIPKALRSFFSPAPASLPAACLHDFLYSKGMATKHGLTRRGADKLFLAWLKIYGVGAIRRRLIYWGVRTGGWTAFSKQNAVFYQGDHNHD
ncbi:MAG: DUF1353 domain-containing protein [Akkermansiaceae bacterium]